MRILILGGDGYLGWPTAMSLSAKGHEIGVVDNFMKRACELEIGVEPLIPVQSLFRRIEVWRACTGHQIEAFIGDLMDYQFVRATLERFMPDAIVHYGEQPSAPYSMIDHHHAVKTQVNNIVGTLNVVFAMRDACPAAHLVKLGTMGEYGTPNIDIEEGFLEIEWKGRRDVLPFPKNPGSFYHLSKVHDSHNLIFAAKVWNLKVTDLNQGVVYGIETDETAIDSRLATSFHYDSIFGTVLNRFCLQAVLGIPLTVYGKGGQTRGFLNLVDTLRCVELVIPSPPSPGTFRVFNQFAELFSVEDLAVIVQKVGAEMGVDVQIRNLENPRLESEYHYYRASNKGLLDLGFQPRLLSDVLLESMMGLIERHKGRADLSRIMPQIQWRPGG